MIDFKKKRYWFPIILFFLIILIISKENYFHNNFKEDEIYGLWMDDNDQYLFRIEFKQDYECNLFFFDKTKETSLNFSGFFNIDTEKNPVLLEIKKIRDFEFPLYSIVDIDNKGYLKIARFSNKWRIRPIDFKEDYFKLKKIIK